MYGGNGDGGGGGEGGERWRWCICICRWWLSIGERRHIVWWLVGVVGVYGLGLKVWCRYVGDCFVRVRG